MHQLLVDHVDRRDWQREILSAAPGQTPVERVKYLVPCLAQARDVSDCKMAAWLLRELDAELDRVEVTADTYSQFMKDVLYDLAESESSTDPDVIKLAKGVARKGGDINLHSSLLSCRRCDFCGRQRALSEPRFRVCKNCRTLCYCSRFCQTEHWYACHREQCPELCAERDAESSSVDSDGWRL